MDDDVSTPVTQLRAALSGARDALVSDTAGRGPLGDALARMSGPELAEFMALADDVKARAAAAQVRVTAEAAHRGEFTSARRGAGSVQAWVREHAFSLQQDGAHHVARLAQDVASSVPGGLWSTGGPDAGAYADPEGAEGVVWGRVVTGEVGAALALTALAEMRRLKDLLQPGVTADVTGVVVDRGVEGGVAAARRVRPFLLARYGLDGEFDEHQDRLRASAYLSSPRVNDAEITEYRLGLTPAQAAILEAAIGPLSKPVPDDATGERDSRPAEQRRAEALASVCAGAASAEGARRRTPGSASMALHVTMFLDDLLGHDVDDDARPAGNDHDGASSVESDDAAAGEEPAAGRARCGLVMGSRAQQTMLAPAVVRQLACDADIIPVVLGSDGEVLDIGRAVRLFTRGQRRALWHRDKCCTYPGCDAPASWSQAHHLIHWADGGPSDLSYGALLCQAHHTLVHTRRLIATVHPPDADGRCVTWDLTPGSYDLALPGRLAAIRAARATQRATAEQRAAERVRLDTGPPERWMVEPSDDVLALWVDEWIAEREAFERLDAHRNAEMDDALATMREDEHERATI